MVRLCLCGIILLTISFWILSILNEGVAEACENQQAVETSTCLIMATE